jgi:hypothetical protein
MNRNRSSLAQKNDIHRLVRPDVRSRGLVAARNSSHLEFLGAALPPVIALATFCMVLLSGLLTGAGQNTMDRLIQQNQVLMALVSLLGVAVLGLAVKNLNGFKNDGRE